MVPHQSQPAKEGQREKRKKNIKKLKIYSDILSAVLGPAVTRGSRGNSYEWDGGPKPLLVIEHTIACGVSLHMTLAFTISPSLSKVISSGINSVFLAV